MPFRYVLVLALAWLLVGYVRLVPGTALPPDGYRAWSFQHLAYSDVIALYGDHYGKEARGLPYVEDRVEYPVILGLALWLPSFLPFGALGHFTATYLVLSLALLGALLALHKIPGTRPYWLGATPALACFAGLNWDLLAVALIALAAFAHARGRLAGTGALVALGISTKLFPGTLAVPILAATEGRDRLRFAGVLAAVLLVVNLPFMAFGFSNWAYFFTYNAGRVATNSAWQIFGMRHGFPIHFVSLGPLLAATVLAGLAARRAARSGGDVARVVRLGATLALVAWVATNKIWSPQYALYGFLGGALAAAPFWLFALLTVVSLLDYLVAFEYLARGMDAGFRDALFYPDAALRTLAWLLLAAFIARALAAAVAVEPEAPRIAAA